VCVVAKCQHSGVTPGANSGGNGGPNQEFAAAFALELAGRTGVVALGLDTDGTDGPKLYARLTQLRQRGSKVGRCPRALQRPFHPRPSEGFVHYVPCEIAASSKLLKNVLKPNQTTLVDG
jgi:hypothetical protein